MQETEIGRFDKLEFVGEIAFSMRLGELLYLPCCKEEDSHQPFIPPNPNWQCQRLSLWESSRVSG